MQQLKNKTGGVIPQGYSADTIRQVRYLPDNIGIVLFGAAKVMDRLHYTAKTLPRLCRTDMMLQIDMEERIDAVREEMKEALMQGGGYKDAMDLCEEELQNILKTTITLARKRAKEVGGSHGSSPSLSSGLGGAKGLNGPHNLGSSFNFGPHSPRENRGRRVKREGFLLLFSFFIYYMFYILLFFFLILLYVDDFRKTKIES